MRKTRLIVYVDKGILEKPHDLLDAVMAHFIKKGVDPATRKKFLVEAMRAPTDKHMLEAVDAWVLVKDAAAFPFRHEKHPVADAEITTTLTGEEVDELITEGDADENKGIEGRVSVDDGTEQEPESGAASDGCDTPDGQDADGDSGSGD